MAGKRADIEAGKSFVTIYAKTDPFTRGLNKARQRLQSFGAELLAVGTQFAMAGAAMLAPFAFGVKAFADFDDAMRQVKAVTGATAVEFEKLTETAKELGRTTSFTAVDVGTLMAELGRAGFKPDQINVMTAAVLNLSRATGTEAAMAAGIMAASIRQFELGAGDAGRVADGLTAAANKSFNTVEQLGEALSYAGPVARDFNMSFEDTLALLGGLGNVGIQGSAAGTALRRLLTLTGAEAEKLKKIFGVTFLDAAGNARPLVDVLGEVNEATKDLGTAARAEKFNEAFGLLGITGASAIGRSVGDIRELKKEIIAAGGAAEKTAAEMDGGIGGVFRRIMSAAEGVQIAIGKALAGAIQGLGDSLTIAMGKATEWISANKEVMATVAATGAVLVATGGSLIALGLSFKVAAAGIGILTTALGAAKIAGMAFSAVASGMGAATMALSVILAGASAATGSNAAAWLLLGSLQSSYPAVAAVVSGALSFITTALAGNSLATGIATAAYGVLAGAASAAATAAAAAWAVITGPIAPFVIVAGAAVAAVTALAGVFAFAAAKGIAFGDAWKGIKGALSTALGIAKEVGGVLMAALSAGDYEAAARAGWLGIQIAFWEGAQGAVNAFKWLFAEAWKFTQRFFTIALQTTKDTMAQIGSAILNPIGNYKKIGDAIGKLASQKFEFSFEANADAAREELAALRSQIDDTGQNATTAAKFEAEANAIKEQIIALRQGEEAAERWRLKQGGATDEQIEAIMRLKSEHSQLAAEQEKVGEGAAEFESVTERIKEQIIVLQQGEEAADRWRMKQAGLTDEQIRTVDAMKAQQKALEKFRDRSEDRVSAITATGDRLLEKGASPQEIARREREAIKKELEAGNIDRQTAAKADEETQARMVERMQKLKDEARSLEEELRTPQQILNDRLAKISQLQDQGVISDKTAVGAEDRARSEVAELIRRSESVEMGRSKSSTATFSGAAALAMGQGGGSDATVRATEKVRDAIREANEKQVEEMRMLRSAIRANGLHHP